MQELASFTIVANSTLRIVELGAELGHVIALNVLLLQELVLGVGIRAVASEFALAKVNDVFTHLSLSLHFDSLVEFLSETLDIPRGFVCFLSSMMYGMNITST